MAGSAISETLRRALIDFRLWAAENDKFVAAQLGAPVYLFPEVVPMGETGVKSEHPHPVYWLCYGIAQKVFLSFVEPLSGGVKMRVAYWLCDEEAWGQIKVRDDSADMREIRARFTNNCIVQRNLCGHLPTGEVGVFLVGERIKAHQFSIASAPGRTWHTEGSHRQPAMKRL